MHKCSYCWWEYRGAKIKVRDDTHDFSLLTQNKNYLLSNFSRKLKQFI